MAESGAALLITALMQALPESLPAESPPSEPEISPPRVQYGKQSDIGSCYSRHARRLGEEGRTVVTVTVKADGSIGGMKFAPGIQPWQEQTARCVIELAKFTAGQRGGVAVAAEVQLPIVFYLTSDTGKAPVLTFPKVVSTPDEVEQAYRACYPPDTVSIAQPKYSVTVSPRGKITDVKLVESSGDEAMDRAGQCMFERVKLEPARRDSQPVSSTVTMPMLLRPPK